VSVRHPRLRPIYVKETGQNKNGLGWIALGHDFFIKQSGWLGFRSPSHTHHTIKTVLNRGSRSDQPSYHGHTRWTPSLPLASAAPRRTSHRASVQLMT